MNFVADAIAEIEGYLEGNRDFCKPQMLRKAPQMLPPNCAVYPILIFIEKTRPEGAKALQPLQW